MVSKMPGPWERLRGAALTVLVVAVMLYVAARLILAVWPVLVVLVIVVTVGWLLWSLREFCKSRW